MGGIPHLPSCSLCESLRTAPPQQSLRLLTDVVSAWCSLHQRKLFEPARYPSVSFTVCTKYDSVYFPGEGFRGHLWQPPTDGENPEYLWLCDVKDSPPFWVLESLIRFRDLPKVNPETGDVVEE